MRKLGKPSYLKLTHFLCSKRCKEYIKENEIRRTLLFPHIIRKLKIRLYPMGHSIATMRITMLFIPRRYAPHQVIACLLGHYLFILVRSSVYYAIVSSVSLCVMVYRVNYLCTEYSFHWLFLCFKHMTLEMECHAACWRFHTYRIMDWGCTESHPLDTEGSLTTQYLHRLLECLFCCFAVA